MAELHVSHYPRRSWELPRDHADEYARRETKTEVADFSLFFGTVKGNPSRDYAKRGPFSTILERPQNYLIIDTQIIPGFDE
jgi:hypothetical protein